MLAGAIVLVLMDQAGVTFLILFMSSIAILVLLMAATGHPSAAAGMTVRRRQAGYGSREFRG